MTSFLLPWLMLAQAAAAPDRDWAQTLREDARAMHATIAANHPGPVNDLDPGFAKRNDDALALALERADRVGDEAGHRYALWGYAAAFDDGHLAVAPTGKAGPLPARWPGFLTGFDDIDRQVVLTRDERAPVPLGALLVGCDGRPADRLAAENVGAFVGRWMLASRRRVAGGNLFVDYGNPFIIRPARCTFRIDGTERSVALDWRPIAAAAIDGRLSETSRRSRMPIGARTLSDRTRWFALSGFDGDPASDDAKALTPMIAAMRTERAMIVAAPRIVLDLRGNNGGSSDWSAQVAEIVWGRQRVEATAGSSGVDWRASAANVRTIAEFGEKLRAAPGTSDEMRHFIDTTLAGLRAAQAKGDALWRYTDPALPRTPGDPPVPPAGPVFFITDARCASACLDAADLWKALGAIQVGQETSADTLYMDTRSDTLPSGLVRVAVPMKVYRGRPRGSNEPLRPVHPYTGDLRDTPALEAWIAALPENRPPVR